MSDIRSRLSDVAQPSWLWGQRASCPLITTAWRPGKMPGRPSRLGYKTRRASGSQELAPPTALEIASRTTDA